MKQPTPPNPYQQAGAQQNADMFASQASSVMNNPNIYTPWGSQTYSIAGYDQIQGADGQMRYVPRYNQTQTLSPDQMQLYGLQTQTGYNLGQTAVQQSAKLRDYMGQNVDTSQLVGWNQGPSAPQLATSFADVGPMQRTAQGGGPIQRQIADVGGLQGSIQGGGPIQRSIASGGNIQMGIQGGGPIQREIADAGGIQKEVGAQSLRQDTAPTDQAAIQQAMQALYQRQAGQRNAAETAQLTARGGGAGSPIGEAANYRQGQEASDAGLQSFLASGQEARSAQEAYNQAGLAMLGQDVTRGQFANSAQQQQMAENALRGQFANSASQQQLQENQALGQFANQAVAQKFGENQAQGQFANAASAQQLQENQALGQFFNAAKAQQFGQNQASGQFANAAAAQQLAENLGLGQFANSATESAYQQALGRAGFGNTSLASMFDMGGAAADRQNALNISQLQEAYAGRNQFLNEILALMGGGGVTAPSFSPYQGQGLSSAPVGGYIGQNYANSANASSMFNQGLFNLVGNVVGGGLSAWKPG